jgi:DNA-directed RNA polymerase specialized sigma24 family protein
MNHKKFQATQLLKEHQNLLYKIAWSYHKTTGVAFSELLSECYLGFAHACQTYAPEKGKFSTWVWHNATHTLNAMWGKKRKERANEVPMDATNLNRKASNNPEHICIARDTIFSELNKEAQTIAYLLFTIPDEQKPSNRTELKNQLRNEGMSWPQIWRGMKELKQFTINKI